MKDSFETDVFGVEKEDGKVQGIIAAVYQSVFGQDAYPSLEEKAANLLYFMIKDHPYADGCKRIAASLFLEFLDKNNALFLDGEKRLSRPVAAGRGRERKVRATQSTAQANDLISVRVQERNRERPPAGDFRNPGG